MHRTSRSFLILSVALLGGILPLGLSAQAIIDLPDRDRPLEVETRDLYSVGSMAGDDWEMFSRVTGVAFDGAGNLYILDTDNYRVVKVDPQGGFLAEMGRGGEGPGEFGMPMAFSVTQEGEVRVFDLGKQGFTLFNPDGSFNTTVPMAGDEIFMPNGGLLSHPGGGMVSGGAGGLRISIGSGAGGADQDVRRVSLFELKDEVEETSLYEGWNPASMNSSGRMETTSAGSIRISAPPMRAFDPELMTGILPDGRIALVDSTDYEVKLIELGRGVVQRIRRPIAPRPVTRRDQEAERDRQLQELEERSASGGGGGRFVVMGGGSSSGSGTGSGRISVPDISAMMKDRIDSMEFGDEMPVLVELVADWAGRLWVRRTGARVGEEGPTDVLTGEGGYLGTLASGSFVIPDAFGPDGLVAYIETDEMDVARIEVKRLSIR